MMPGRHYALATTQSPNGNTGKLYLLTKEYGELIAIKLALLYRRDGWRLIDSGLDPLCTDSSHVNGTECNHPLGHSGSHEWELDEDHRSLNNA